MVDPMATIPAVRVLHVLGACALLTAAPVRAAIVNLVVNGAFTDGTVGFTTDYPMSTNLTGDGQCAVGTDPHLFHPAALSFGDHTSGTGRMMLVNAATSPGVIAWRQTVPVLPNSAYQFSGWAASWGSDGTGKDQSPAVLTLL